MSAEYQKRLNGFPESLYLERTVSPGGRVSWSREGGRSQTESHENTENLKIVEVYRIKNTVETSQKLPRHTPRNPSLNADREKSARMSPVSRFPAKIRLAARWRFERFTATTISVLRQPVI